MGAHGQIDLSGGNAVALNQKFLYDSVDLMGKDVIRAHEGKFLPVISKKKFYERDNRLIGCRACVHNVGRILKPLIK